MRALGLQALLEMKSERSLKSSSCPTWQVLLHTANTIDRMQLLCLTDMCPNVPIARSPAGPHPAVEHGCSPRTQFQHTLEKQTFHSKAEEVT